MPSNSTIEGGRKKMGSTCERNTRELTLALPSLHRPFYHYCYYYYSLFILCCLASLSAPSIAELVEASTSTTQGCSQGERDALLTFKFSIQDPSNRLASWNSQYDCCGWIGVVCHNDTTTTHIHVVELNLGNPDIHDDKTALWGEKLSSSLLSLTHLESLNLSWNNFGGAQIPEFIGSFQKLRYLELQQSSFGGIIPPQLGNLSSLHYLDLSFNQGYALRVQSLDWLTRLYSLTYLDMSLVDLSVVSHSWLSIVNMLPFLQELRLQGCSLDQIPSSLSHLNLTSLATLDLSANDFNSTLPSWLWQLTTLSYLDLSRTFHGSIPVGIGNLRSLTELILFYTSLSGPLPNEIWSLTHLIELDLSFCLLEEPIPVGIANLTSLQKLFLTNCSLSGLIPVEIIGKLFNITTLDLSFNSLEGVISQPHFTNLTNLQDLDLSHNPLLIVAIDHNWAAPFQLQRLALNSLKLGPAFPTWLRSHNSIRELSLSNTSIEGNLPDWFWTSFPKFVLIDISYNKISGTLPLSLESHTDLYILNLRFNMFEGSIPKLPTNIWLIDLSINSFSGPLPLNISSLFYNILSYNQIHGRIPLSICNSTQLQMLDWSHNQIYGEIPHCEWPKTNYLRLVHLGNNNLTGEIPSSIGQLNILQSLHLNNNNLYGRIPSSLQNCSGLQHLDLSYNKLFGSIPIWIGQSLQRLTILQLRSNMFSGGLPLHIEQLSNLQVIDLANNHLTGSIPYSLGNLSAIVSTSKTMESVPFEISILTTVYGEESNSINIVTKGHEYSFSKILYLVKSIDLSNNSLVGEIPKELGFLEGLQSLNLSRNHLKGNIPNTISGMKSLETLDLSFNILSGAIPQELSTLNSLNHLNLSYNNLSGVIPQGYQLQTLQDASIYKGNAYLCGALVNKSCSGDENNTTIHGDHKHSSNMISVYLSTTLGFLFGLWSVLVIILFKKEWRNFYFMKIDNICDIVYVQIKKRLNRLTM